MYKPKLESCIDDIMTIIFGGYRFCVIGEDDDVDFGVPVYDEENAVWKGWTEVNCNDQYTIEEFMEGLSEEYPAEIIFEAVCEVNMRKNYIEV